MADAADLLREARTAAGISQTELARRSGTSQAAVARYETGQVSPAASTLERMLQACGYTLGLRPYRPGAFLIDIIMSQRAEITEQAAAHGASHVRIVGAAARGVIDDGSTAVELLVDLDADSDAGCVDDLAQELTVLMGRRVVIAWAVGPPPGGAGAAHGAGIPL